MRAIVGRGHHDISINHYQVNRAKLQNKKAGLDSLYDVVCVFLGQDKTQEWVQTAQSAANKACHKAADSKEEAQQGKERTAGIMQQTGEQVMNMVQGALDRVKNTLGINETTRVKK